MPHIIEEITLEDIRATKPETIWCSVNTCWWTHRETDLRQRRDSTLPCDPRGGMLMMYEAKQFLAAAEANPAHYGKHGLAAFIAAHNDNCVVSPSDRRNTCLESWQEYNDLLDRAKAEGDGPAWRACAGCGAEITDKDWELCPEHGPQDYCGECGLACGCGKMEATE